MQLGLFQKNVEGGGSTGFRTPTTCELLIFFRGPHVNCLFLQVGTTCEFFFYQKSGPCIIFSNLGPYVNCLFSQTKTTRELFNFLEQPLHITVPTCKYKKAAGGFCPQGETHKTTLGRVDRHADICMDVDLCMDICMDVCTTYIQAYILRSPLYLQCRLIDGG